MTAVRHVAVVDPAMRIPELDCFNRMARVSPVPLTYHLPALYGMDSLLRTTEGLCGVVVLGSGASVNEEHAWQDALRAWLDPLLAADVPMLGLCYGHQLLARMTGGEVGFLHADQHKEQGLRTVRVGADPLWGDAQELPLLVSHREAVTVAPPGAVVAAASDACAVEALVWPGFRRWSFQPHPEATPAFAINNGITLAPQEESALAGGHRYVDRFLVALKPPAEPVAAVARPPRAVPDPLARAAAALEAARIAREEASRGRSQIVRETRAREELDGLKRDAPGTPSAPADSTGSPKPRRL